MALVGHISGSAQSQSVIGITGSVVFSNSTVFPSLSAVGSDVVFFVSGTVGGKNVAGQKTVSVFGGDTVVSGSLTVGSGSVKITSNDIQFSGPSNRIQLLGSDIKFFDANNTSGKTLSELAAGGGGGGGTVFVDGGTKAYTTSSIVIGKAQYADSIASNVFFYVSGSNAGDADAVLAGDTVVSGSVAIRDNDSVVTIGYGPSSGVGQITSLNGNLVLDTAGGSRVIVDTDLEIAGANIYAGGGGGARNIFTDNVTPANLITIGGAGGKTTIAGGLEVTGNYISGSAGNNLTLGASGDVTVAGDLTVAGNDIKSSTATAISLSGTTVTAQGHLIVKGDLYISGTTTTIDSTVVEIQDPVIGLGFSSGSVAGLPGDRGFIGGITGTGNNVALVWSNASGSFVATRTTTAPGISPIVVSALLPVRAAKLEVNGTTAYITSSDTQTLELNGGSGSGINFTVGSSVAFAKFKDNGSNAEFGAVSSKQLSISGSLINLNAGSSGISLQKNGTGFASITGNSATLSIIPSAGFLTASIVNSVAELINFGGAATLINVGNPSGNVIFAGDVAVNGGDITTSVATFNLVNANATTVNFAGDATSLNIANSATFAQTMNLATASTGSSTYNLMTGATATSATKTVNLGSGGVAGSTTNVNIGGGLGGTTTVTGSLAAKGDITLGDTTSNTITATGRFNADLMPSQDVAYNLGGPTLRWANMYTGDLHLKNERGDWTIIEESDFLTITNNRNGKRYKFVLEEIG